MLPLLSHWCPPNDDEVWVERGAHCQFCDWRAPLRTITPHKGGRSARLYIRINPAIKQRIEALAAEQNCSVADLIESWTEQY